MLIRIHGNQKLIERFGGGGHSNYRIIKLALSQQIDWYFACWYKFRKAKNYFNNFWVVLVKNKCGLLGHVTLKPQEWVDEMSWFFCMLIQEVKLKVALTNYCPKYSNLLLCPLEMAASAFFTHDYFQQTHVYVSEAIITD